MSSMNPTIRLKDIEVAQRCAMTINAYWAERGLNAGAALGKRATIRSNLNSLDFHLPAPARAAPANSSERATSARSKPPDREGGQTKNRPRADHAPAGAARQSRANSPGGLNLR